MQSVIENLLKMGPFPSTESPPAEVFKKYRDQLNEIKTPVSKQEAIALCALFGFGDFLGLAWKLIEIIETAEDWDPKNCSNVSSEWQEIFKMRASQAFHNYKLLKINKNSKNSEKLNYIISELTNFLGEKNFKKNKKTFVRIHSEEVSHVIDFQLGQNSLEGKFCVNLEVVKSSKKLDRNTRVSDRLGGNMWIELNYDYKSLSSNIDLIKRNISAFGEVFFSQNSSLENCK